MARMNLLRRLPVLGKTNLPVFEQTFSWQHRTALMIHTQATKAEPDIKSGVKMRAWQTHGYEGVDGLVMETVRVPPVLRPGDLLLKIHAASVNPIDTAVIGGYGKDVLNMMRLIGQLEQGNTATPLEFPLIGGRDFAGEVVSVGHGVEGVSFGDMVFGVVSPQAQGTHAEYTIASASNVCLMPDNITPEEAASVPYAGLTAWSALVVSGMLTPSKARNVRVLVLGAAGGVGSILCQILAAWGAQVTGLCSCDAINLVRDFGVEALDYTDPGTKEALIADGGYNMVINTSGVEDLDYLNTLRPWIGSSYITLSPPLLKNIDNSGITLGLLKSVKDVLCSNTSSLSEGRAYKWAFYMPNPWALKQITRMLADYKIRPVIDKVFPFTETLTAYRYVMEGHARGKTIISFL